MIETLNVILADIDETLCRKGGQIFPITRQAIETLHAQGVKFGVATGRAINSRVFEMNTFWNLSFEFDVIIGMNGGHLWTKDHPEVKNYHLLPESSIQEILERMRPLNLNAIIYEDEHMVALRHDVFQEESSKRNHVETIITNGDEARLYAHSNNNILFRYDMEREEEVMTYVRTLSCDKYRAMRTAPGCVEFMDPRVSKGTGLLNYAAEEGIDPSTIMGFGDNDNDVELLEEAGWGVCLKNGTEACKKAADAITEYTCVEDGVGHYLYDHWINR
ncbi:MAG: HAD family hydrolase [Solobacterium sp.]|nr:HAD family hydrolase [Solobacterium sp.]